MVAGFLRDDRELVQKSVGLGRRPGNHRSADRVSMSHTLAQKLSGWESRPTY